jgi:hypothetical protein
LNHDVFGHGATGSNTQAESQKIDFEAVKHGSHHMRLNLQAFESLSKLLQENKHFV